MPQAINRKTLERTKIINSVFALALCHNVTPVSEFEYVETGNFYISILVKVSVLIERISRGTAFLLV